jgi:hypothetical protein
MASAVSEARRCSREVNTAAIKAAPAGQVLAEADANKHFPN